MGVVIPLVQKNLEGGQCLDVVGKISISTAYTCYNATGNRAQVQIGVEGVRDLIDGISITIGEAGSSKSYDIKNNSQTLGVTMYGGSSILEIPLDKEERTFILPADSKPNSIKIYPILKTGQTCGISDSISNIIDCVAI